jgi:ribosomal protein S18 acetylase RimI-like enzyme
MDDSGVQLFVCLGSAELLVVRIVLATEKEVEEIMSLIKDCTKDMESHGIHQWGDFYPTREIIEEDIENRSMYVAKGNEMVLGIITVNEEQPQEWRNVNWSPQEGRAVTIHRLAVKPTWQEQGIGQKLLDHAEKYATNNGYTAIRLDAYSGNARALRLYEKHEYIRVGQISFPNRALVFYCYEKILKKP